MRRGSRGGRNGHGGGMGQGPAHGMQPDYPMGGFDGGMQQQGLPHMAMGMLPGPGPGSQMHGMMPMGGYSMPAAPGMSPHDFPGPIMGDAGMYQPGFGGLPPGFPGPPSFNGPPRGAFGGPGPGDGGKGRCFTCGQDGHWSRDCPRNAGTNMAFPRRQGVEVAANDFCQHFVDTGQRPQNFLVDTQPSARHQEYPKLQQLAEAADDQVKKYNTPAYSLRADLKTLKLNIKTFGTKFDTILIDPPWEEYVRRAPGFVQDLDSWTWQEIRDLDIDAIADMPCFLFLWCGSAEGLDAGRHCMHKWGFKRIEDICWIKSNTDPNRKYLSASNQDSKSILTRTKEHCLVGLRGQVKRGPDNHIVHTNFDTDVIVSEEPPLGSTMKPDELYSLIERFAMGRRRLELFGEDHNIRPGWVTVGNKITESNFKPMVYTKHFTIPSGAVWTTNAAMCRPPNRVPPGAPILVPTNEIIEELRPRSPPGRR